MAKTKDKWMKMFLECLCDLATHDVDVFLSKRKYVTIKDENIKVKGFWNDTDSKDLKLACSVKGSYKKWMPIFIHEYCHFLQWKEKSRLWKQNRGLSASVMDKILHNEPISSDKINLYLNRSRDLELDCEKRTVAIFKKYKVPLNIKYYIQCANSYIHFYNHIKTYRSWYPLNNKPYSNKKLIEACSTRFYKSYKRIPPKLAMLFEKYYPSK